VKKRCTRKQLGTKLRERGYPISDSKLNKLCAPSVGKGPPVDGWFGPRPLYDEDQGIAWAEALLRSERSALQTQPDHAGPANGGNELAARTSHQEITA
jgi:hypothetical protein